MVNFISNEIIKSNHSLIHSIILALEYFSNQFLRYVYSHTALLNVCLYVQNEEASSFLEEVLSFSHAILLKSYRLPEKVQMLISFMAKSQKIIPTMQINLSNC